MFSPLRLSGVFRFLENAPLLVTTGTPKRLAHVDRTPRLVFILFFFFDEGSRFLRTDDSTGFFIVRFYPSLICLVPRHRTIVAFSRFLS